MNVKYLTCSPHGTAAGTTASPRSTSSISRRAKQDEHETIMICTANPGIRIIDAIARVLKDERARLGIHPPRFPERQSRAEDHGRRGYNICLGLCKRLIALGFNNSTTTYGYDAFCSRVLQTTATITNIYPFNWYSVASSTGAGARYSTTNSYVFNGDSLVATVDQQIADGVATGSPQTSYIHPDHLGSTNVVTNASGTVVQTLDYYP